LYLDDAMNHWPQKQMCQLLQLTNENETLRSAATLVRDLGFDYFQFSVALNGPANPRLAGMGNLPRKWTERYNVMEYAKTDPVLAHCRRSVTPIRWTDELFTTTPTLQRDACAHGVSHGISLAVHDARGHMSMLSLTRRTLAVNEDEFYAKGGCCLWLCNLLHERQGEHFIHALGRSTPELSLRERQILHWLAEGKTAGETAMILNLSERTVNFHITSAVRKTGQKNKTQAVIHATRTGLLSGVTPA